MHHRPRTAGLLLCLLAAGTSAAAAEWSRFRGPNGTGAAADREVPVQWQAADVLWKTAIPGKGNSSPVLWGDKVFLQSAATDGSERWLLCLSASSGKILWKQAVPGAPARTHKRNTLASSTPAVDGERVYSVFWDGKDVTLFAHDLNGTLQWKLNLGPFNSQHGPGHSPLVYDGKVIVADDQDGAAALLAVDARSGALVWRVERKPYRACYSTPFVVENQDTGPQLLVASTTAVTGYDPKTGKELWNYTWSAARKPLRTVASPIVADGVVLAHGGDGDGSRHLIAVRLGGKGDVTRTHLAWETQKDSPYVPCMLASGPYAFGVNDAGAAVCYVAKTGEKLWSQRLAGNVSASPVLIDGKIFAADMQGQVYVFEAAPKFKLLATNSVGEPVMATPAVAGGRLFIRGEANLFCIGKPKAK